jgi:hypothetical protein
MIRLDKQRSHCKQKDISIQLLGMKTWWQSYEVLAWTVLRSCIVLCSIGILTRTLSLSKASLKGLDVLVTGAGAVADVLELDSDIVSL